ncbi:MAG: NAD(P)/FAD-dependent oxidoreductase [Bacteroidales bacterium]|nr:NAD(P)/FAD-dependent oxidoreductase [Bacteroidales bacterium]
MIKVAIIGAGAAGYFTAIRLKTSAPKADVTLFEKGRVPLAKVAVTGGGRCNLTNTFAHVTDLHQVYPRGATLMKRLFKHFDHRDAYAWFEAHGVPLVVQEDQCVFPLSQQSGSVIGSLQREAQRLGVVLRTGHTLTTLVPQPDGRLHLTFRQGVEAAFDAVVIATGGAPRVSSFDYLAALGHSIEPPVPSLFTFDIPDAALRALMGTVVESAIAYIPGTKFRAVGPLLVTHWGTSGPATLKLSALAARHLADSAYRFTLAINWVHEANTEAVQAELIQLATAHTACQLSSIRPYGLPTRLWLHLVAKADLVPEKRWGELGRKGINRLVQLLCCDTYAVAGRGVWKEEFVTCGGVSLHDMHAATLESKHVPGLYFAGEVTDVDAITGGFNLQAAWTMGYAVGEAIAAKAAKAR